MNAKISVKNMTYKGCFFLFIGTQIGTIRTDGKVGGCRGGRASIHDFVDK